MYTIDSLGWIEFFTEGPLSGKYSKYTGNISKIITPTIILFDVYKKIKRERSEEDALQAVSLMNRTSVITLGESIALLAADLSLQFSLPMADAIVYATAIEENSKVVTSDAHFKGLKSVIFIS